MFITSHGVAGLCLADKGDRGVLVFVQQLLSPI